MNKKFIHCVKKRLIVELDGKQHIRNQEYDLERNLYLIALGYKVIRFWNSEVDSDIGIVINNINKVLITLS